MASAPENKKNVSVTGILIALILLVTGVIVYSFWPSPSAPPVITEQLIQEQAAATREMVDQPALAPLITDTISPPASSQRIASDIQTEAPPEDAIEPVGPIEQVEQTPCQELSEELISFFRELDQREYLAPYEIEGTSRLHLENISRKLFANPPIVTRENDDLFSILKNVNHFYRILGKKDLFILKDILSHESEEIEHLLSLFYRWSEIGTQCRVQDVSDSPAPFDLPLTDLYEYAAFLLNTMGGQAYLYRRIPRLRLLFRYYAVLILDRANDEGVNRHGIDIRYPIDSLTEEMEEFPRLTRRSDYLTVLYGLQDKYLALYGEEGASESPR